MIRIRKLILSFFILCFAIVTNSFSQSYLSENRKALEPVILDEEFTDWTGISDIANESGSGNATIKAMNNNDFLFLYFEIEEMIDIQEDDRMVLYIDTDNDPQTGESINGIGAEVVFGFGNSTGKVLLNGNQYTIGPRDLYMVISPTVWSDKYEISLDRNVQFDGSDLFTANEMKIVMRDKVAGTYSPSESGGASYTFSDYTFNPLPDYSIQKTSDSLIRFMSHNVHFDDIFNSANQASFKSMYQAIKPEIIGFQEIYDHTDEEVAGLVENILPSGEGEYWYSAAVADNILVSKFLIKEVYSVKNTGNGAFLVDLRPKYNTDILILNAHTPCCDNHSSRQEEIDAMMAFIRDAKDGNGDISIPDKTPVMLMGDMNVVGDPQNITTLLTGDIINESDYGSDFNPDWDGSDFLDAKPLTSHLPMTFTHWSESGSGNYSNGRLDMIVYSGSVMNLMNSYVMYTNSLPQDSLDRYSLNKTDSEGASDHLPLVADFSITEEQNGYELINVRLNNKNGVPEYLDQTVTLSGIITADEEFGSNLAFMQDKEAGVSIYGTEFTENFTKGDSITITADVKYYNGLTRLQYNSGSSSISVHGASKVPEPKKVTISEVLNQKWDDYELLEGMLIKIEKVEIIEEGTFSAGTNYQLTNGTDTLNLRVDANTNLVDSEIPGGKISITGILSQNAVSSPYSSGYQLLPRNMTDFENFVPLEGISPLRQNDDQGIPVLLDSLVTVSGIVTLSDEFGSSGPGYMQDSSAGVALYGESLIAELNTGDSITITSSVGFYNGLTEIEYDATNTNITKHNSADIPQPRVVTFEEVLNQDWDDFESIEGLLVKVRNVEIVEEGNFEGGNYTITDGTQNLLMRVEYETDIPGNAIPEGQGEIIGMLGQYDFNAPYSQGYQLLPRKITDLNFSQNSSLITIESPTEHQVIYGGDTLTVQWSAEDLVNLNLYYKTWDDPDWSAIASNINAGKGAYDWEIPAIGEDSCQIKLEDVSNSNQFTISGKFYVKSGDAVSTESDLMNHSRRVKAYPNPFSESISISFYLEKSKKLTMDILDSQGRVVHQKVISGTSIGKNEIKLNTAKLQSGIYILRLRNGKRIMAYRMVVKNTRE